MFGKILGGLIEAVVDSAKSRTPSDSGIIDYGNTTIGGGHDHRYNKGEDRTPAQKQADKAKKK